MNEESPRLLSIGEFARRSRLSVSALRFYGDCGLIVPARVDSWTGYRSYAAAQLRDADLVRQLRLLGMPIVEVRAILTGSATAGRAALDAHWARLERQRERSAHAMAEAQRLLDSREELNVSATATVDALDLAQAIRQVLPAAAALRGGEYPAAVLFDVREDALRLVATDAHRLAVRDLAAPTQGAGTIPVAAPDAARLADQLMAAGGPIEIGVDEGELIVDRQAALPRAADHYPDYEAVLRRVGEARLIVQADELRARLNRESELVVLHLAEERSEAGDVALNAEYRGEELRIGFNPGFLADALEARIGSDVVIQLGGPHDPALIASADDGTLTYLVMPIRLKEPANA